MTEFQQERGIDPRRAGPRRLTDQEQLAAEREPDLARLESKVRSGGRLDDNDVGLLRALKYRSGGLERRAAALLEMVPPKTGRR